MEKYITSSPEETEKLGFKLGKMLHGGEVFLESEEGKGSTFTVEFVV